MHPIFFHTPLNLMVLCRTLRYKLYEAKRLTAQQAVPPILPYFPAE